MNSFYKIKAAIFPMQAMLPWGFFSQNYIHENHIYVSRYNGSLSVVTFVVTECVAIRAGASCQLPRPHRTGIPHGMHYTGMNFYCIEVPPEMHN